MFELSVANLAGGSLRLTGNPDYDVLSVAGLAPAAAEINTTPLSIIDGARFNSSRVGLRNIVIRLNINGEIEENRIKLYNIFKPKHAVRIYYKNDHFNVYIDGYVETFENNFFAMLQQPQISIICPDPYWRDIATTTIDFEEATALFTFPFSMPAEGIPFSSVSSSATVFHNDGEDTGGTITFRALDDGVKNPVFYNVSENTFFGVTCTMSRNDVVMINTERGNKYVRLYTAAGAMTNLLGARAEGSSWVTFKHGDTQIRYDAAEGYAKLNCQLSLTKIYEGV